MSKISNLDELVTERKRIERNITEQKLVISEGINELKERFEPILHPHPIFNLLKKGQSNNSILKVVASIGIDLLLGQTLLSKTNWLTKLLVPIFLKGVSAKAIGSVTRALPHR